MEFKGNISEYLKVIFGWNAKFDQLGFLKDKLTFAHLNTGEYSILDIEGISIIAILPKAIKDFRMLKELAISVNKKLQMPIVLILNSIDAYQRRSLIESRINFIVPERQVYLPSIGISLNERKLGKRQINEGQLSPMATSVILYHLRYPQSEGMNISEMATNMKYSVKTLSLAISELEQHKLITIKRESRNKIIHFSTTKKELWEKAFHLMKNPVEKKLFTNNVHVIKEIGTKSSDTALSEISMLAAPQQEIYAVYSRHPRLNELDLNPYEGTIEVEIWKTDPRLTASEGIADAFSLALSYKEDDDPRIKIELERIIKKSFND